MYCILAHLTTVTHTHRYRGFIHIMSTFTGNISVSTSGVLASESLDLSSAAESFNKSYKQSFTNGTAANQANQMFVDTRSVSGSSNDDIDLAGVLVDGLGSTITFTSVKTIVIKAASTNGDALHIGAGTNPFFSFLGDATDLIKLQPGGLFAITNPEADGYTVTTGTADILRIANQDAGTASYDIILYGEV